MFDFDSFLGFLAINDAIKETEQEEQEEQRRREEERQREEDLLHEKEACKIELELWDESQRQEKLDREREWIRSEREQLEWEMNNADFHHYDKEEIQRRLDDLEDRP